MFNEGCSIEVFADELRRRSAENQRNAQTDSTALSEKHIRNLRNNNSVGCTTQIHTTLLFYSFYLMNYGNYIWWNRKENVSLQREKLCLRSVNISTRAVNTSLRTLYISLRCGNIKSTEQKRKMSGIVIKKPE